jgi:acyl-coenzyme A synthetase/AMP-(fatty) acid ligase
MAKIELHNWYGPTETNVCSFHRITEDDLAAADSIPIGKSCPYARFAFAWDSPEAGRAGAGELLVAGDSLMAGYWRRAAPTAKAMQEDAHGTRFYRTGDFVRLNGRGEILFLGRRDRQVKLHGYRVQLDEVEATLRKHLPGAEIACALIKTDGADPILVAAITGPDDAGSADSIRDSAANELPLYMMPERVFVLDALPRNERGKIDYGLLATRLAAEYQRVAQC